MSRPVLREREREVPPRLTKFLETRDNLVTFPPEAVDLLLDRAAWPSEWGLTVPGDLTNKDVAAIGAIDDPKQCGANRLAVELAEVKGSGEV